MPKNPEKSPRTVSARPEAPWVPRDTPLIEQKWLLKVARRSVEPEQQNDLAMLIFKERSFFVFHDGNASMQVIDMAIVIRY